jgi:hypothetical protein
MPKIWQVTNFKDEIAQLKVKKKKLRKLADSMEAVIDRKRHFKLELRPRNQVHRETQSCQNRYHRGS